MLYTNENENGLDITTSNHDDFKKQDKQILKLNFEQ